MARSSTMSGPVEGVAAAPALSCAMQGVCSSGEGWDRSITAGSTGLPTPAQPDERVLHALLQQLRPSRCKVSCSLALPGNLLTTSDPQLIQDREQISSYACLCSEGWIIAHA